MRVPGGTFCLFFLISFIFSFSWRDLLPVIGRAARLLVSCSRRRGCALELVYIFIYGHNIPFSIVINCVIGSLMNLDNAIGQSIQNVKWKRGLEGFFCESIKAQCLNRALYKLIITSLKNSGRISKATPAASPTSRRSALGAPHAIKSDGQTHFESRALFVYSF